MARSEENLYVGTLESSQVIECPVCLETLYSPVFQCPNGHLICSNCLKQINICPTCRKAMPKEPIRNLAIENLVMKCPNFKLGCQAKFNRRDRADHLLNCEYRSRGYCNLIGLEKVGVQCNKMISKCELPLHMKDEHRLTLIENDEALISQELDIENPICQLKWFPVLFSAFDEYFIFDCEIIPDQSGSGASRIIWKCISARSVSVAQKFSVKMTLCPTDMSISLKWRGKAISVDQIQKEDGNKFSLTMNTLREHTISKNLNKLNWKMKIVIQRSSSIAFIQNQISPEINMTTSVQLMRTIEGIEGKYQYVSGTRWGNNVFDEIVYSRNGSLWTRKVRNRYQYSFNFGQEATYKYRGSVYKSTVTIEINKLVHRVKLYVGGHFHADITEIEEFSDNKMLTTDIYFGKTFTAVYKKVNG